MSAIQALVVQPTGWQVTTMEPTLEGLQAAVGGCIEPVSPVEDGDWQAFVDEEGKNKHLPINLLATRLARQNGWPAGDVLCGPAVFVGTTGRGDTLDAPRRFLMQLTEFAVALELIAVLAVEP